MTVRTTRAGARYGQCRQPWLQQYPLLSSASAVQVNAPVSGSTV